jgi:hypothetical protein
LPVGLAGGVIGTLIPDPCLPLLTWHILQYSKVLLNFQLCSSARPVLFGTFATIVFPAHANTSSFRGFLFLRGNNAIVELAMFDAFLKVKTDLLLQKHHQRRGFGWARFDSL